MNQFKERLRQIKKKYITNQHTTNTDVTTRVHTLQKHIQLAETLLRLNEAFVDESKALTVNAKTSAHYAHTKNVTHQFLHMLANV